MNKKVLILSGSPRKGGNSEILCEQFMSGAKESGNTVELIRISEKKIGYCTACYACKQTGKCIHKDDMEEILGKMMNADVIVLSTPVYFYTMSGQMKTLIDRTLSRYREISNKDFYFIATAADGIATMKRTMDGLCGFTDCLPGSKVKGMIYGAGVWQKGEIEGNKAMDEAYKTGLNI